MMTQSLDRESCVDVPQQTVLNQLLGRIGLGFGMEFRRLSAEQGVPMTPLSDRVFLVSSVQREVEAELQRRQQSKQCR